MAPRFIYTTALPRAASPRRTLNTFHINESMVEGIPSERTVAAGLVLCDPRREDRTAYLSLFRCTNNLESLERFLDFSLDFLSDEGYQRLIGPVGMSAYLCSGILEDHWNQVPPSFTPYNPPYLPELMSETFKPLSTSQLYAIDIPAGALPRPVGPAQLGPFPPERLHNDLLPLLAEAGSSWSGFPQADALEAAFLLRWIGYGPTQAWLASMDGEAAGFALLQPDLSPWLRMAKGGRNLFCRIWLDRAIREPASQGRLLFAAVLPAWRGQGIGRQLFQQALAVAGDHGWKRLVIGPLSEELKSLRSFLEHQGAVPGQIYRLYQMEIR
jgi:GNAT superfamily N-acetyltransferase